MSRAFQYIPQPRRSRQCGQAVVAMILGTSLSDAVKLIGHGRGTKAREIRKALRARGVNIAEKPQMARYHQIPRFAVLRLSRPTGVNWHWMLVWDGCIYDPAGNHEERVRRGWAITSFFELDGAAVAQSQEAA